MQHTACLLLFSGLPGVVSFFLNVAECRGSSLSPSGRGRKRTKKRLMAAQTGKSRLG